MVLPSVYDELRFEELCQDLNMDMGAKQDALNSYKKIVKNYTLEVKYSIKNVNKRI